MTEGTESLRSELQHAMASLAHEQQQQQRQREELAVMHARVADMQSALHVNATTAARARDAYVAAARVQQSLDVAQQQRHQHSNNSSGSSDDNKAADDDDDDDDGALASREVYMSALSAKDDECRALQDEVDALTANVRDLSAADGDAQRRLAVARLVSMLDQLRSALEAKVHEGADGDAEVRAQECYKTLQELTRERARALRLLQHKERALRDAVALKQRRVRELRAEACRNLGTLRDANERQVLTVTERIQRERRALLAELDRLVVTNDRLAAVLRDTRQTLASSATDKAGAVASSSNNNKGRSSSSGGGGATTTALSLRDDDNAAGGDNGASDVADVERVRLHERIAAATAELQRLERRTADVKARMDADASRYTEKMTHLQAKIAVYHDEANRLESENKELKTTCDSLAALLQ